MGLTSGCVKAILLITNSLWGIASILILASGAVLIGVAPQIIIYFLFIIGAVGLIASLLGCCGICQEHVCMTTTFAALILVSLILQIVCVVFSTRIEGVRKYADEDVNKYWEMELKEEGSMDFLQQAFECCGKDTPNDYVALNRSYPKSCYPHETINRTALYTTGCITKTEDAYVNAVNGLVGGSWGTIIFTIIILIFAIYLIMRFRRKQRHYNY